MLWRLCFNNRRILFRRFAILTEQEKQYTWENPRQVIILAMGPSRMQCPYDAETWALNMGYQQIATVHRDSKVAKMGRIDKLFQVHKQVVSPTGTVYFKWDDFLQLAEHGCEMWNIHEFGCERCGRDLPFKKYPLDEIIEKFDFGYFSDTICYMIAFALDQATEGCKKEHTLKLKYPIRLRLYGVDLQDPEEYGEEKGGVEAWIAYALGLGADVTISSGSTLLLTNTGVPYGFDVPDKKLYDPYTILTTGERMSDEELQANMDKVVEKMEEIASQMYPDYHKYQGEAANGMHREKVYTLSELIAENDCTS